VCAAAAATASGGGADPISALTPWRRRKPSHPARARSRRRKSSHLARARSRRFCFSNAAQRVALSQKHLRDLLAVLESNRPITREMRQSLASIVEQHLGRPPGRPAGSIDEELLISTLVVAVLHKKHGWKLEVAADAVAGQADPEVRRKRSISLKRAYPKLDKKKNYTVSETLVNSVRKRFSGNK